MNHIFLVVLLSVFALRCTGDMLKVYHSQLVREAIEDGSIAQLALRSLWSLGLKALNKLDF